MEITSAICGENEAGRYCNRTIQEWLAVLNSEIHACSCESFLRQLKDGWLSMKGCMQPTLFY